MTGVAAFSKKTRVVVEINPKPAIQKKLSLAVLTGKKRGLERPSRAALAASVRHTEGNNLAHLRQNNVR